MKKGEIPCLVATSSLELGIHMGAVDLVIQVESPKSVARGLQRVGRAGHELDAVSKGRIFPKFRADLLESAVVVKRMLEGGIEETTPAACRPGARRRPSRSPRRSAPGTGQHPAACARCRGRRRRCGRTRSSAAPSKRTVPASARTKPQMTLKSVVLPAPLGPITPTTSPGATASDTSSRAVNPPKRTVTPATSSPITQGCCSAAAHPSSVCAKVAACAVVGRAQGRRELHEHRSPRARRDPIRTERILLSLSERSEEVVEATIAALRAEIPAYGEADDAFLEDVRHQVRLHHRTKLACLLADVEASPDDLAFARRAAMRRARSGFGLRTTSAPSASASRSSGRDPRHGGRRPARARGGAHARHAPAAYWTSRRPPSAVPSPSSKPPVDAIAPACRAPAGGRVAGARAAVRGRPVLRARRRDHGAGAGGGDCRAGVRPGHDQRGLLALGPRQRPDARRRTAAVRRGARARPRLQHRQALRGWSPFTSGSATRAFRSPSASRCGGRRGPAPARLPRAQARRWSASARRAACRPPAHVELPLPHADRRRETASPTRQPRAARGPGPRWAPCANTVRALAAADAHRRAAELLQVPRTRRSTAYNASRS